ncbi:MAG: hypothetical protein BZ136_01800 [Methanosphaera sp. rholeuAM74]|nr:MAG: hypothetical protein BZ136_01800 [Methanosphaera sp. rholeuAM74]
MLNEIFGDYPQIKVIDYLLTNPFAELSKLQLAVGSDISRITLNKFIDDLISKQLIIQTSNSKYKLNLKSPIIIKLNMFLDELNKIAITEALTYDEDYDELTDEELDKLLDENAPDVDLYNIEKEISMMENYNVVIEEVEEQYVLTI